MNKVKIIILFLVLTACQSGAKKYAATESTPQNYKPAKIEILTSLGQNKNAVFSPDGEWLAYASSHRVIHDRAQLYLMHLKSRNERRITFQDGDVYDVAFGALADRIYYSSSTDEIKESLTLIKTLSPEIQTEVKNLSPATDLLQSPLPNTEIYTSSIDGHDIERLTIHPGFDGKISPVQQHKNLLFTSYDDKAKKFSVHIRAPGQDQRKVFKNNYSEESPSLSPNFKYLVWVRWSEDQKSSALIVADGKGQHEKVLISGAARHLTPSWLPNSEEIIWSSDLNNGTHFHLFIIKKDGSCLRQLTFEDGRQISPHISPDSQKVLFTKQTGTNSQIALMDLQPPPCPEPTTSIQSDHALSSPPQTH